MTTHSHRPGRRTYGATALIAVAALFVGLVLLSNFALRGARLDLTESQLYSIAPGTKRILASLQEPVNLYFFFSQEATRSDPQIRAYAERVRELLEELSARSNGKVRLTVIDPAPFSEDEDRAGEFGLVAAPPQPGAEPIYFGLAGTNSTDGREIIPVFAAQKEEFLEYDVVSLIHRLGNPQRPTIGLLSALPVDASFDQMSGRMQPGWTSIAQIRELFDVRNVATDVAKIDDDIDVLMVVHPKDLSEATLYAIDQFVMRGGKLLAFLDPQSESDPAAAQGGPMAMASRSSTLGPLLEAWGVQFDPAQVLGDRDLGLTVAMRQDQPPSQHIAVIGFNRDSMNPKDVVTAALDTLNVMTAGSLSKKEGATATFEPLIESSTNSVLLPAMRLAFLPDSQSLLEGFKPSGQKHAVAARVHGKLKSAYAGGKPASAAASIDHLAESTGDADLIVFADSDVLSDPLWVHMQSFMGQRIAMAVANNGDFLANALDNLAGSSDLISIRGRQSFFRPFTRVDELRRRADDQLRAKAKELDQELRDTEAKLSALEAGRGGEGSSLVLSPEQEAELTRFQQERVRIRKELRDVQRSLDVEIKSLGNWLRVLNIALVPALLAVGAILLAVARRRRVRAGRAAAHTG